MQEAAALVYSHALESSPRRTAAAVLVYRIAVVGGNPLQRSKGWGPVVSDLPRFLRRAWP